MTHDGRDLYARCFIVIRKYMVWPKTTLAPLILSPSMRLKPSSLKRQSKFGGPLPRIAHMQPSAAAQSRLPVRKGLGSAFPSALA